MLRKDLYKVNFKDSSEKNLAALVTRTDFFFNLNQANYKRSKIEFTKIPTLNNNKKRF